MIYNEKPCNAGANCNTDTILGYPQNIYNFISNTENCVNKSMLHHYGDTVIEFF